MTTINRISTEYYMDVSRGRVAGHDCFDAIGEREGAATTVSGDDIWRGTATTLPIPDQTTGEQMTLVSSSTQDNPGGTGIGTVLIHYLDTNWEEQTETRTLNGQTGVDTVATDIKFVQDIYAIDVGSGGVAAGDIKIHKKGAVTTIYDMIAIGGNMSLTISKMVPANKTFFLTKWQASSTASKPIFVRIRSTDQRGILYDGANPTFLFKDTAAVQDSTYIRDFKCPREIPAKSIIKITAWSTQAGGNISASYEGILIDD